jgi:Protein of unknown function (DUF1761)
LAHSEREAIVFELNFLAIFTAAVVVFVVSTVWYMVFAAARGSLTPSVNATQASARPPLWKVMLEIIRSFVLASVLAGLANRLGIRDVWGAMSLGLVMWIGFPIILLSGSVIWDNIPWKVAAIHAGDWLLKLVILSIIVGLWH